MNLKGQAHEHSPQGVGAFAPQSGGRYWEMTTYVNEENKYADARQFIMGDENLESAPFDIANNQIVIKPYTIMLVKGKKASNPCIGSTIHAVSSNSSMCGGGSNEATIYVSGATKYYISPPAANGLSIVFGPTIPVAPAATTTYLFSPQ